MKIEVCAQAYEGILTKDDLKIVHGGGGCGYGDPIDRDPDAVLRDVLDGLVSVKCAKDIYGVAIDVEELHLDIAGTGQLRKSIREERLK